MPRYSTTSMGGRVYSTPRHGPWPAETGVIAVGGRPDAAAPDEAGGASDPVRARRGASAKNPPLIEASLPDWFDIGESPFTIATLSALGVGGIINLENARDQWAASHIQHVVSELRQRIAGVAQADAQRHFQGTAPSGFRAYSSSFATSVQEAKSKLGPSFDGLPDRGLLEKRRHQRLDRVLRRSLPKTQERAAEQGIRLMRGWFADEIRTPRQRQEYRRAFAAEYVRSGLYHLDLLAELRARDGGPISTESLREYLWDALTLATTANPNVRHTFTWPAGADAALREALRRGLLQPGAARVARSALRFLRPGMPLELSAEQARCLGVLREKDAYFLYPEREAWAALKTINGLGETMRRRVADAQPEIVGRRAVARGAPHAPILAGPDRNAQGEYLLSFVKAWKELGGDLESAAQALRVPTLFLRFVAPEAQPPHDPGVAREVAALEALTRAPQPSELLAAAAAGAIKGG